VTTPTSGYAPDMARRIREEYIDDDPVVVEREPVVRRVVTERHYGGGMGYGLNPLAWVLAAALVVFLLLLLLGGIR
jgi:hypothetical protein